MEHKKIIPSEKNTRILPESMNLITTSGNLIITHSSSLKEQTLDAIIDYVFLRYEKIRFFFETPPVKIHIYIFPHQSLFHLFYLGREGEDWLVGATGNGLVQIIDPNAVTNNGQTFETMQKVVVHEIVHYFTFLRGYTKKRYMSEGIAAYLSEQHDERYIGVIKKKLPYIDGIAEQLFKGNTDEGKFAELGGYALAYTIIDYMLQCYGEEALKKYFISEYSHPFGLLKIDFDVFINDWKQYLRQIYS